jgi:polyisoprenoid-binding protein YceI
VVIRKFWISLFLFPIVLLAACGTTAGSATTSSDVSTSGAAATTTTPTVSTTSSSGSGSSASTSTSSNGSASNGASAVAGDIQFTLDPSQSQATYKARETLANIGSPSEAVGKTSQVSGTIAFTDSGMIDTSVSKITIDLSTLQSDKSQRDNYIKRNTLNTDQYPSAVFVPTEVQGLSWPLPTSGQSTFKLIGDLTVHGQTSKTTWDVTATFASQQVKGTATTTVKFEDFGMKPPKTMLVLSVEDNLTLELDFVFDQAG